LFEHIERLAAKYNDFTFVTKARPRQPRPAAQVDELKFGGKRKNSVNNR
jgi:hypothetical protein